MVESAGLEGLTFPLLDLINDAGDILRRELQDGHSFLVVDG